MLAAYGGCPYTATEIAGLGGTAKEKEPVASATPLVEYPALESITVTPSPGTWLPSNESTRYPETLEMIGQSVAFCPDDAGREREDPRRPRRVSGGARTD